MSRRDLLIASFFVALAAIFFAPVVLGGASLVPFDNLFRFPPWSAFAAQAGVTTPHNELVSDLVLENYAWKKFIAESLRAREIPLWNPYLFAGVPFLAAGQHSALYPFSILFYVLPIERAFGYFVALQIALAAINLFAFGRVLGLSRFASAIGAIVYAFSGFMIVSTAFPMVISAAAWLPAVLACVELCARSGSAPRRVFFALGGAILLGIQFLAGHVEISYYVVIVAAFYALWRFLTLHPLREGGVAFRFLLLVALMLGIGIALGAVQLIPLYELGQNNFRSGSVTYSDVIGWAFPLRQIITFVIPDFFGNPTHHSYVDVFDLTTRAVPTGTIFWGIKNYVEAGAYVGILPLLLALVAIVSSFRFLLSGSINRGPATANLNRTTRLFATLALLSLLFTFGTPLYAILFYGLPGFNQLHTPFRWVFPYTLSLAVLAGVGAEALAQKVEFADVRVRRLFPWAFIWLGAAVLGALALTWIFRAPTLAFTERLVQSSNLASKAFDSGRMFYAYEFRNLFWFAIFLIGAGAVVRVSRCAIYLPARWGGQPLWKPLALVLVIVDLFVIGMGFDPAVDAHLADFTPPAVKFLLEDRSYYRITSYDQRGGPEEKVFNPNVGMFYGIADIRGYDSMIPKRYADLMGALAPQDQLLDNRIAPFYNPEPLDSPIIALLNVKYVLTKRPLPNAGYTLVYDDEIKIYRNERALPRAFMVSQARAINDQAALLGQMQSFDPTREVLLEQDPGTPNTSACSLNPVTISKYTSSEAIVNSDQACAGWLVLTDSYFPGWISQIDGADAPLYRADYNFRAVFVPAGEHTVRFKYSPLSFRVGAIATFLGAMLLLLALAYLAWQRFYRADEASPMGVVAKNSLLPMTTALLMKMISIAFQLIYLRVLGPTGAGRYAWAVNLWFFANTITDFGLGILVTREVSRDRAQANRYLTNTVILRVLLWMISLIPFGLIAAIYVRYFDITPDTAVAFALLMIGILPSTLAASLAFLFNAYERFEYRVAVDFTTQLLSVALGVVVLLSGWGYVGLAAVSIATNLYTLAAFYYLVRRTLFVPHIESDRPSLRWMFSESFPLMLNNLLSSLFFRIDVFILQPLKGDTVLGYYSTAYKFIDALNFIPSNFTLAIFPALSRFAASAKDAMLRAYILSLKILLWIALPITVGTVFVARETIQVFGGDAYLPDSAIALQLLIWFLPFSFVNSVTHYVLIALGQQRFLTRAFVIGVAFNVAANLIAIPPLGYAGAALVTVLSEMVLLTPFYYSVRKNLAPVPFWSLVWRPALASALMGLGMWGMIGRVGLIAAIPLAGLSYGVLLIALGALGSDERALLRRLVPERWHRMARIAE